jgi:hypothetical protein
MAPQAGILYRATQLMAQGRSTKHLHIQMDSIVRRMKPGKDDDITASLLGKVCQTLYLNLLRRYIYVTEAILKFSN